MKIRQYTAATMQEARLKIKMDLGPDAVILHTRQFKKGGLFGLFGKEMVEVLAAVDAPQPKFTLSPKPEAERTVPQAEQPVEPPPQAAAPAAAPMTPPPATPPSTPSANEVSELKAAMGEMKSMLSTVVSQLEAVPVRGDWPAELQRLHERLIQSEFEPGLARTLLGGLPKDIGFEEAVRALETPLTELLRAAGPIKAGSGSPTIVALIGPTGVGKTTTIAKLAANFRLIGQKDVGLITIDTYRVAAVEQLKTYGDIIGIPVEVVVTPNALKEALGRFSNKDLILIDTAGRSPSNRMHLHELKGYLDFPQPKEVHLVLSATTTRANLGRITESFAQVGFDRVVFTKLDESVSYGGLVSAAHTLAKPISYVTTGQSVPDDIREADARAIARMLVDELLA